MKLSDVADLITLKNYLSGVVENLTIQLENAQVKNIQTKINELDALIIKSALELDLSYYLTETPKVIREFKSTEDVEEVAKRYISKKEAEISESPTK